LAAMEFENEEAVIEGVVMDYEGEPVADAKLEIEGTSKTAMSNENGEFKFIDVIPSKYRMRVNLTKNGNKKVSYVHGFKNNLVIKIFNQEPVKFPVIIESSRKTKVSGIVKIAETGEALYGANLAFSKNGSFITGVTSQFNGEFISRLDPGHYDILVTYVGLVDLVGTISVKAGYNHKIELFP